MNITKMFVKKKLVYIYLSDGGFFKVAKKGFSELDLYEGLEVDYDDITSIRVKSYEVAANKDAAILLARSFLSEKQLRQKLMKREHKKRFINSTIKYCKEYDLIDDKRFARVFLNTLRLKGKSKRAIETYLYKAGVKPKIINNALRAITIRTESKLLKDAIRKYYPLYEHKEDCKEVFIKALIRKGFDYSNTRRLIEIYIRNIKRKNRGER